MGGGGYLLQLHYERLLINKPLSRRLWRLHTDRLARDALSRVRDGVLYGELAVWSELPNLDVGRLRLLTGREHRGAETVLIGRALPQKLYASTATALSLVTRWTTTAMWPFR